MSCTNSVLVRSSTVGAAALGQDLLVLVGEELLQVLGLGVGQREGLGAHRLQVGDLRRCASSASFSLAASSSVGAISTTLPFLRFDRPLDCRMMSSAWSHGTSFRRSVRLPPTVSLVMMFRPGEVGDHLQHRAHFDVLEVERELLARVARGGALHQLVRVFLDRLHLEDELGVGLVGRVFPEAARLDHHARVAALLEGVDEAHRRAEVAHVEAAHEVARHVGVDEVDHDLAALLADVDADVGRGEVDHDAAFAGVAAAEVDVAQVVAHGGAGRGLGEHRRRRRAGRGGDRRQLPVGGLRAVDRDDELACRPRGCV